ncbi:MAG TPA: NAD(P)H-dependent oxidoreductase [Solirubrobacteraceae bacterium]|nr:NAD(P)H-dependent oxidoreductase [Solirubrobacteraceae bacterium]
MRLLAVSGSLRRDSHNSRLLRAAAQQLPPGVELEFYDGLKQIPPFDEDDEAAPAREVVEWREAIDGADAVLFATPEYNSSIPGQLKNALDWASRPKAQAALRNKPVAVIGASTSMFGALWAQAELRKVLSAAGARVLDTELAVATAHEAFDDEEQLIEAELGDALSSVVQDLADAAQRRAQMTRVEA